MISCCVVSPRSLRVLLWAMYSVALVCCHCALAVDGPPQTKQAPQLTLLPRGYHTFLEHRKPFTSSGMSRGAASAVEQQPTDVHYVPQAVCHGNHCSKSQLPTFIQCRARLLGEQANPSNGTCWSLMTPSFSNERDNRPYPSCVILPTALTVRSGDTFARKLRMLLEGKTTASSTGEVLDYFGDSIVQVLEVGGEEGGAHLLAGHPADALRLVGHIVDGLAPHHRQAHRHLQPHGRTIHPNAQTSSSSVKDRSVSRSFSVSSGDSAEGRIQEQQAAATGQLMKRITPSRASPEDVGDAEYNLDHPAIRRNMVPLRGVAPEDHPVVVADEVFEEEDEDTDGSGLAEPISNIQLHPHFHIPADAEDGAEEGELKNDGDCGPQQWECALEIPHTLEDHHAYEGTHLVCIVAERNAVLAAWNAIASSSPEAPLVLLSVFDVLSDFQMASLDADGEKAKRAVDEAVGLVCTLHFRIANHGPLTPKIALVVLVTTLLLFGGSMFCIMFPQDEEEEKKLKILSEKQRQQVRGGGNGNDDTFWTGSRKGPAPPPAMSRAGRTVVDEEFSVDEAMLRQLGIEARNARGEANVRRVADPTTTTNARNTNRHITAKSNAKANNNQGNRNVAFAVPPFQEVRHEDTMDGHGGGDDDDGVFFGQSEAFMRSARRSLNPAMLDVQRTMNDDAGTLGNFYSNPNGLSLGELIRRNSPASSSMSLSSQQRLRSHREQVKPLLGFEELHVTVSSPSSANNSMSQSGMSPPPHLAVAHTIHHHHSLHIPATPNRTPEGSPPPTGDTYPIDGW